MNDIHEAGLEPARFLVDNVGLLPKGRVLDVAMGNGRNALFLAKMGFRVEGIDISPEAINRVLVLARQTGVSLGARVADLEDNYQIEKNAYEAIICFNYLQRSLIPRIKDGLRLGGVVVYETFIIEQAQFGRPTNPEYLLKHNELLDMFRDFRCLRYQEGITENRRAVAGIVAEKVLELRRTEDRTGD
ncbi:class I SAM-dependent methyltransferase [Chloroflexota bacterium]